MTTTTQSEKPGKADPQFVNVGDLVQVKGYMTNHFGTVALVARNLDDETVVLKAIAPGDDGFDNHEFVSLTYRPTGENLTGNSHEYYHTWISKVIHRAVPLPPPPPKPKPKVRKVTTPEELAEVLQAGKAKEELVHVDLSGEAQGGSNASVRTNAGSSGKSRGRKKAN